MQIPAKAASALWRRRCSLCCLLPIIASNNCTGSIANDYNWLRRIGLYDDEVRRKDQLQSRRQRIPSLAATAIAPYTINDPPALGPAKRPLPLMAAIPEPILEEFKNVGLGFHAPCFTPNLLLSMKRRLCAAAYRWARGP